MIEIEKKIQLSEFIIGEDGESRHGRDVKIEKIEIEGHEKCQLFKYAMLYAQRYLENKQAVGVDEQQVLCFVRNINEDME